MKSILILLALAVAAIFVFNSCKSKSSAMKSKPMVKDLWLNSHRPSSMAHTYSAQFGTEFSADNWQEMVIPIVGFTYTAGHIYHLRVEPLNDDKVNMGYKLVEIVSTETDPIQLITDIYVIREFPGEIAPEELRDVRCTMELHAANRTIMGNAPCNSYRGSITKLTSSEIEFGPAMATKMACPQLSVEQLFFDTLGLVKKYTRKGLQLHLQDEDGNTLMIAQKVD